MKDPPAPPALDLEDHNDTVAIGPPDLAAEISEMLVVNGILRKPQGGACSYLQERPSAQLAFA